VEELSDEVNMSRMQLHRKLKALTDQSPGEFLRKFRLERAKQMLSVPGMQVSEVCYKVGFNNLSNFSKVFKEFTGVTPSEFMSAATEKV
jgi:AraC-like DNA-binding protein